MEKTKFYKMNLATSTCDTCKGLDQYLLLIFPISTKIFDLFIPVKVNRKFSNSNLEFLVKIWQIFRQSFGQGFGQSFVQGFGQGFRISFGQCFGQCFGQSFVQSFVQSFRQSFGQSF